MEYDAVPQSIDLIPKRSPRPKWYQPITVYCCYAKWVHIHAQPCRRFHTRESVEAFVSLEETDLPRRGTRILFRRFLSIRNPSALRDTKCITLQRWITGDTLWL
ncbi:hypothetical protein KUCAC02_033584 [Chaenocephalus aceratus]|nr:hypothetical protein KUCAC02_033584 [Chaenocephalus aceratus]